MNQQRRHDAAPPGAGPQRPETAAAGRTAIEDGRELLNQQRRHDAAPPGAGPQRPETAAADRTAIEDGRELLNQQRRHDAAPPGAGPQRPETAAADRTAIEDGRELLNQQRRHDAAWTGAAERLVPGALPRASGDGRRLGGAAGHDNSGAIARTGDAEGGGGGEGEAQGEAHAASASTSVWSPPDVPAARPSTAAVSSPITEQGQARDSASPTVFGDEANGQADLQSRRDDGGGDAGPDLTERHEQHAPGRQYAETTSASPFRGDSRADRMLAFLGGARHERAPPSPPPAGQERLGRVAGDGAPAGGPVPATAAPIGITAAERRAVGSSSTRAASTSAAGSGAERPSAHPDTLSDDGLRDAGVSGRRHGGGGSSDGGEHDEDDAPSGDPDAASIGGMPQPPVGVPRTDDLLAFLDGARKSETPRASRAAEIADLAHTLTERVLVGERADGAQQIRVTLRGDVLGRTEVTIAQGADGLEVHFEPASNGAAFLLRERGAELARTLSERLDSRVVVGVAAIGELGTGSGGGGGGGGGGERNSRSRGFDEIVSYVAERR